MWTVYCIIHIDSGRRYVGITKRSFNRRWSQHITQSRESLGSRSHFHNAIRKHGRDGFSYEVLEKCSSLEVANLAEECWIEFYDTRNPELGFNLTKGGGHAPHPIKNPWLRPGFREKHPSTIAACHTPAARAKQKAIMTPEKRSAATKAAMERPEVRAKRAVFQKDPAYRARISAASSAAINNPETLAKISENSKNRSPEVRAKISASLRVAAARPDVKARRSKISKEIRTRPEVQAKMAARQTSDETKAKISAAAKDRKHSPESIQKQRELYLARSSQCKFCSDSLGDGKRTCIGGHIACQACHELHKSKFATFIRPDGSRL